VFENRAPERNQLSYSLPEDIEPVSDAIASWCKSYPEIKTELIAVFSQRLGRHPNLSRKATLQSVRK
jgi:hypothetical protein